MTTKTKPKSKRATRKTKSTFPVTAEEPAFYAKALTVGGRFILAGILLRAACSVLFRGKALV